MVQYNAVLIITGTVKETSRDKIYQVVGLESLADRRLSKNFVFFHKIVLILQPSYLQNYLSPYKNVRTYLTRSLTQKSIISFSAKI